jgi:acyl-CoA thioesterase YciA
MSDSLAPGRPHAWGEPSLRVTLMPRDTNAWGTIFGGVILSYIDLAGGVEARKHGSHTFVTVAMREVVFHEPVYVGDLVSFYTRTERVGRTSVTVKVMVEAQRIDEGGRRVKVTEAEAVYVAVDRTRRPMAIHPAGDQAGPEAAGPEAAGPEAAAPEAAAPEAAGPEPAAPEAAGPIAGMLRPSRPPRQAGRSGAASRPRARKPPARRKPAR